MTLSRGWSSILSPNQETDMSFETLSPLDNKLRKRAWILAALVLCVPLVAMQFNTEVQWTAGDFIAAAIIIGGIGLMAEFLVRLSRDGFYRAGSACALAAVFLTIWSNLAVGIIGSEDNMYNVWYFGLVLLAILGSAIVQFKAAGMAAVSLGAVAIMAVLGLLADDTPARVWPQTAFLATPWALAATFFWHARNRARDKSPAGAD
jgi:hypothetical protein